MTQMTFAHKHSVLFDTVDNIAADLKLYIDANYLADSFTQGT